MRKNELYIYMRAPIWCFKTLKPKLSSAMKSIQNTNQKKEKGKHTYSRVIGLLEYNIYILFWRITNTYNLHEITQKQADVSLL